MKFRWPWKKYDSPVGRFVEDTDKLGVVVKNIKCIADSILEDVKLLRKATESAYLQSYKISLENERLREELKKYGK